MAKNTALLKRLQKDGAPDTPTPSSSVEPDRPAPPKPVTAAAETDRKLETPPAAALTPSGSAPATNQGTKAEPLPVTDPHAVWSALIRTPQGQRLTDTRIQSLSPQRFDTVFLAALKSAFLAGWDARSEGGVK